MTSPANITRGVRALRHLLQQETFDLRGLDVADFRRWLGLHLARWHRDPVFMQRARIRDLRRAHSPLRILEEEHRHAAAADAASAAFSRLRWLDRELSDTAKAVAGLTDALHHAVPERCAALLTLGHVILARDQTCLDWSRRHEHVHVRQYERWGPLLLPMYLAASGVLYLRGLDPYLDNPFEREAFGQAD